MKRLNSFLTKAFVVDCSRDVPVEPYFLNSEQVRLFSYWDVTDCGLFGNNYQSVICGGLIDPPQCPPKFNTAACGGGLAVLTKLKGQNYELDGCVYHFFAEYACSIDPLGT